MMNEQDDKREALITDTVVVTEAETPTIYADLYQALVRRLVEIADEPSATTRMIDYDRVARAHGQLKEETDDSLSSPLG
jgi:hypothetical protein